MRLQIFLFILLASLIGCNNRQAHIAEMGAHVMPFDLDRTTHIFENQPEGGQQQVISDDDDQEQIDLIRNHLAEQAEKFAEGDFHSPAMIHGEAMPGLHELIMGHEKLVITYSDIEAGGQIVYQSNDEEIISAIHKWFDAQLTDHGSHAQDSR